MNLHFVTGIDGVTKVVICGVCGGNQKDHVYSEKYICETYVNTIFSEDRRCIGWNFVRTNSSP